ncbi:hypothetical protein NMY22_g1210 [Coprinellus aureogranulatus]|nr:hypothetical protein NMY22_g1210 [Coprinellus aureogranulatus]
MRMTEVQMLAQAKQLGNILALRSMISALRPENFTLEVVDVVLHHICNGLPNPLPQYTYEDDYPSMSDTVMGAAICANDALYLLTHICPPPLALQMHDKILEHFDELMDCLNFLVWYPDHTRTSPAESVCNPTKACVALIHIIHHAGNRQAELAQSLKVINYAIAAWAAQDYKGLPWIASSHTDTCPTIKLIHSLLAFSPECQQIVCDLLGGDSKESAFLRQRFVENARQRCDDMTNTRRAPEEERRREFSKRQHKSLAEKFSTGMTTVLESTMLYLDSVQAVVESLCINSVIAKSFLTSDYFRSFAEALKSWMVFQSDKETDGVERYIGFELATRVQGLANIQNTKYRKLSLLAQLYMVHGGLLDVLVEAMQSVPKSDKINSRNLEQSLLMVKQLCSRSPKLGAMLAKPLSEARPKPMDVSFIRGTGYEEMWRSLALHVTASAAVDLIDDEKIVICDYMVVVPRHQAAKAEDMLWVPHILVLFQIMPKEGLELTTPGRVQQSGSGDRCELANITLADGKFDAVLSLTNAIMRYFAWSVDPILPQDYLKMHGLVKSGPNGDLLTLNHYLDRRFQRLILHYVKDAKTNGLRLVEYQFPFADRFVLTLALLQKTSPYYGTVSTTSRSVSKFNADDWSLNSANPMLQVGELPRLLNETDLLPEYPADSREDDRPQIDLTPIREFNLTLCYGKEWHRFPGHFLVPNSINVEFIKSEFNGLLPGHFLTPAPNSHLLASKWWPRPQTTYIPSGFNDLNIEEPSRYVPVDQCDYLVDLDFPENPVFSKLEPRYATDSRTWERVHCEKFLDARNSPLLTRVLWFPGKHWESSNSYGDYCILKNIKSMTKKEAQVALQHKNV